MGGIVLEEIMLAPVMALAARTEVTEARQRGLPVSAAAAALLDQETTWKHLMGHRVERDVRYVHQSDFVRAWIVTRVGLGT